MVQIQPSAEGAPYPSHVVAFALLGSGGVNSPKIASVDVINVSKVEAAPLPPYIAVPLSAAAALEGAVQLPDPDAPQRNLSSIDPACAECVERNHEGLKCYSAAEHEAACSYWLIPTGTLPPPPPFAHP